MTSSTPSSEGEFQRQVLDRLDKLDQDLQRTNSRLDNQLNSMTTVLVSVILVTGLAVLARIALDVWLQLQ